MAAPAPVGQAAGLIRTAPHTRERVDGSTDVVLLAIRSGRLAELVLQRALRPVGLDGSQLAVLYALSTTQPAHSLAHGDLCRLLAQTPSGVTRTVRRLESSGLVERQGDPGDGRATIVALTPEGHLKADDGVVRMMDAFEDVFTAAGVDDVSDLAPPLARLLDLLAVERHVAVPGGPSVVPTHNTGGAAPTVGEVIRGARLARGLTQRQLAAHLGVGAPHLSKVEAGTEQASTAVLGRAAQALGLDPDELALRAGVLPPWAVTAAAADPAGALEALRGWSANRGR